MGGAATKKACVSDHGKKKKPCSERHESAENEEQSVFEEEAEESILSPGAEKRKRSESSSVKSERLTSEELDLSQDSNISGFSRSSVRSSKRLKGMGETGYNKPGPPTPGRRVSLGNLSLPKEKIDMSRVSARSQQSLKTPLLDATN